MNSQKKVVLVTGGARGIGRAISLRLAADGFAVAVNYTANRKAADEVVSAIAANGGTALAVLADVSDGAAVVAMFDTVERELGSLHALVNNAGIMALKPIAETDDATFDRMFAVNTKGTFHTLREAAKRLGNGGRIVNVSTSVVALALPGYAVYAATKAAVDCFTTILSKEMRGRNITVNSIAPGPTATDLFMEGKTPERIEQLAKMPPLERLGAPDDIAAAVSFLIGPDGRWVNGQIIRANGGII
jgi:3-oxoacyl-[acyl-carrier protein] reductase